MNGQFWVWRSPLGAHPAPPFETITGIPLTESHNLEGASALFDVLILGVALSAAEQEHYYAMPFEQWAQTLAPEFMHSHCLPSDIELYRLERSPEWVSERRHLLGKRLFNLLADLAQPISSPTLCLNG